MDVLKSLLSTFKGGVMINWYFIGAAILLGILVFRILLDSLYRQIIENNWPKGLSKEVMIESWLLVSLETDEEYRIRADRMKLNDCAFFFLKDFKVPNKCNKDDPIILLNKPDDIWGHTLVLSKSEFDSRYSKVKAFNSYKEYVMFIRSRNYPT